MDIYQLTALAAQVANRHKFIVEEYKRLASKEMSTAKQVDYLKAASAAAAQVARLTKMGGELIGGSGVAARKPKAFQPGAQVRATTASLPLVDDES